MARKKSIPVVAQDTPLRPPTSAPEVKKGADSMATPSGSFSSTATHPTCVHCSLTFSELSVTEFRDHVAACTRPSTANGGSSTSSLSSLPLSPSPLSPYVSHLTPVIGSKEVKVTKEIAKVPAHPAKLKPIVANTELDAVANSCIIPEVIQKLVESDPIRPYLDPNTLFDYYDQGEEPEVDSKDPDLSENLESEDLAINGEPSKPTDLVETLPEPVENSEVAEAPDSPAKKKAIPKRSDTTQKFPFPRFTPAEIFEEYLNDPEELDYTELYHRTSKVADTLASYQLEYDSIEKEILAHETLIRAEAKRAEDDAKEVAEERRLLEDEARERVAAIFKEQLKFEQREFQNFLADFEGNNPDDSDTPQHLRNLRNPQFMALINKRKRLAKNREDHLENAPYPEIKPTKEEIAAEKRKRGRLMDPVRFDDMKTADAYGFDYSAHIKHYGAQPLADNPRRSQAKMQAKPANGNELSSTGIETGETSRTRIQRNKTKRLYDAELSASGESDEDGLPAKRARRPKIFEDGVESTGRARPNPYSRSGTPPVRTFASGKRVGRPPAKSKLQAVHMPPRSESPRPLPAGDAFGGDGQRSGTESRNLGPLAEAQLHDAAESLVNQTVSGKIVIAPPVKKKHAGGRPRKYPLVPPTTAAAAETMAIDSAAPPKPKNKGGRPRKAPILEDEESTIKIEAAPQYENDVLQSTEQADGSQDPSGSDDRRPKRKRTSADSDQSPIVVDLTPFQVVDAPPKKRRARAPKETTTDREFPDTSDTKSNGNRDGTSVGGSVAPGFFKKRKARGEGVLSFPPTDDPQAEDDSDADIDEESLDPEAREALRLKRVRKEKSRKLSRSMKNRWATGGMQEAQETRRLNNIAKKAAKEKAMAEAEAAGIPYVPPVDTPNPASASKSTPNTSSKTTPNPVPKTPVLKSKISAKKESSRKVKQPPPLVTQERRTSTRPRKPRVLGFDGVDDEDDEDDDDIEKQFASEYDRFQALTSPGNHGLGKRVRKSMMDLSTVDYASDDSEDIFEDDSDY